MSSVILYDEVSCSCKSFHGSEASFWNALLSQATSLVTQDFSDIM